MGRRKTISDDEVLRIAREVFRARGHTASTREVAEAAGISEAVLYQRFGTKNELFFTAMHQTGPDVAELLGPPDPPDDARKYLNAIILRIAKHFADVIPLALRVMTHPSFDPALLARARVGGRGELAEGLALRLASLARRQQVAPGSEKAAARLLVSVAHDWALGNVLAHGTSPQSLQQLKGFVDVIWAGLKPSTAPASDPSRNHQPPRRRNTGPKRK